MELAKSIVLSLVVSGIVMITVGTYFEITALFLVFGVIAGLSGSMYKKTRGEIRRFHTIVFSLFIISGIALLANGLIASEVSIYNIESQKFLSAFAIMFGCWVSTVAVALIRFRDDPDDIEVVNGA